VIPCPSCSTENTDDSFYCKRCGISLGSDEPTLTALEGAAERAGRTLNRLNTGTLVGGRYRIDGFVGEGGMGRVYRASDLQAARPVAIKQLSPSYAEDRPAVERFRREIEVAQKLDHQNLVRVYDAGKWEGMSYLAMEYVDGDSLKERIQQRKTVDPESAVALLLQLCDGLEAIHDQGVVHRDVKPANVLIDRSGTVKLCDFGLAFTEGVTLTRLTESGASMGTPEYMAPEQIEGKRVDSRADIYALGVLMYETFTGEIPFTGDSPLAVALQHLNRAALPPRMRNPALPIYLDRIVLKAMEKEPGARYQSVAEIREELSQRRRAPKKQTEKHPVTGDVIVEDARSEGAVLVIHARQQRREWTPGMALQYREAFYLLESCQLDGGSTHPFVYSFTPWPAGEVFRRLVHYEEIGPDPPSGGLGESWRRLFRR
jgi:serine/threonine-protein kinase